MQPDFKDENAIAFFNALESIESVDECRDFLTDLCTIKELQSMISRYHVARMLNRRAPYTEIVEKTGASTATISRVNRSLSYGSDGYKRILERQKDKENGSV